MPYFRSLCGERGIVRFRIVWLYLTFQNRSIYIYTYIDECSSQINIIIYCLGHFFYRSSKLTKQTLMKFLLNFLARSKTKVVDYIYLHCQRIWERLDELFICFRWWQSHMLCFLVASSVLYRWMSHPLRAFLVNSPNFCTDWRMNSNFYLLATHFFKYTFQQIFYLILYHI